MKTSPERGAGRANQKLRTRTAILEACQELVRTGSEVTMPEVARVALVSEATAYRYFPDLVSLLREVTAGLWPTPAEALAPIADASDPVVRVAFACEYLLQGVLAYQGAVRAALAATITRPGEVVGRPGIRFGLIDLALAPLEGTLAVTDPRGFVELKRGLAAVIGAECLFSLTDLCGLSPDDAVATLVGVATTITRAAVRRSPRGAASGGPDGDESVGGAAEHLGAVGGAGV